MKLFNIVFFFSSIIFFGACGNIPENKPNEPVKKPKSTVKVPVFNADSAYFYIWSQVDFGPRVPNTEAHAKCATYLFNKLSQFTDTALVQNFKTRAFDGTVLNGKNIIGSFSPEKNNRILLCAHWDSRPFADHDKNPENHNTPIDGANDGASGVGVLLEIARHLSQQTSRIGVDIIFFDTEDYGPPKDNQRQGTDNFWALGSQHWSKNPHKYDYYAKYGILLDMVGAKDAGFYMEGYSLLYASHVLKKVWNTAHRLNFQAYFIFEQLGYIDDDHKPINETLKIPTIDIIHLDQESSNNTFFEHWHTIDDTMDKIDKNTLKVVGQTLLTVIYEEK
ncbi:MAG: M28 family peptidase [Bacteroidales bacterium]|nr:M28 family peptidase [Bacteroidales bacterium]